MSPKKIFTTFEIGNAKAIDVSKQRHPWICTRLRFLAANDTLVGGIRHTAAFINCQYASGELCSRIICLRLVFVRTANLLLLRLIPMKLIKDGI